jgi:MtrB/PioB family decaheme-associated outer membrane protein
VDLGGAWASGEIELGWQPITGDDDAAKFDEYRDMRQWIARGHFLFEDGDRLHYLQGLFEDVGQRDERYSLEGGRYGTWSVWGSFSELPHNQSNDALSPYSGVSSGNLTLPFARPSPDLAADVAAANHRQLLGFRTLTAEGGAKLRATSRLEVESGYRLLDKQGTNFRGGLSSGFTFSDFATPVDERIHEVTTDLRWRGEAWNATFNYTGNLYDNRQGKGLTLDSQQTAVDQVGSSSRWRMALAPDNSSHSFTAAGNYLLPTSFPARVTASFGYGLRLQDESFLAATSNSALLPDPLLTPSRDDLDGKVNTWLGDLRLTARPLPDLNLDFHYRIYDYDNDSDTVSLLATVSADRSVDDAVPGEFDRRSVANEYTRQEASADASYRVREDTTLGFGWEWEQWSRSDDREVSRTNEQGPNLRVDYRPAPWAQIQASYAYRIRSRTGYNPFAYLEESVNPSDPALQTCLAQPPQCSLVFDELRKYPQADRRRNEASLIARFLPRDDLDFGLNAGADVSDYQNSDYGLTDDEYWYVGTDVGWSPVERLHLAASYSYEQGLIKQTSRERPIDLDWNTRTRERVHYAGFAATALLVPDLVDLELSYDFQSGKVRNDSGGPNPDAVDWPTVKNELHSFGIALLWQVHEHLRIKSAYRLERYTQNDFQVDDLPPTSGNNILMSSDPGDYKAHIYGLSVIYDF